MALRDVLLFVTVFGSLPLIIVQPFYGIVVWLWLGFMNPQTLAWGFAKNIQFQLIVAVVTTFAWLVSRESKLLPPSWLPRLVVLFAVWMSVTTPFALSPAEANPKWVTMLKIMALTYIAFTVVNTRWRVNLIVWVIVLSIAFYGVRGGIFAILTGGQFLVWGPEGTFIGANNAIALALLMVLPLMRYLQLQLPKYWMRLAMFGAMAASGLAILATYSRGAFVASVAVVIFLTMKSARSILYVAVICLVGSASVIFMPDAWVERMQTITNYEEDDSAIGRIQAWTFGTRVALDRPVVGGGFNVYHDRRLWQQYAPDLQIAQGKAAHSIYFEVLGEHGFVGLALFLTIAAVAWRTCGRISRRTRGLDDLAWAADLARMLQVSFVAFLVGGAFLNKALFDLYYMLIVLTTAVDRIVVTHLAEEPKPSAEPGMDAALSPGAPRV